MILIVDHLGVVVNDCAKSERFYCDALGCTLSERWHNEELKAVNLTCGQLTIELLEYNDPGRRPSTAPGVINHLAFKVADLDHQIQRLQGLGAIFETDSPKSINANKRVIFFRGPGGERIELLEER